MAENGLIDLRIVAPSDEAKSIGDQIHRDPKFVEVVLRETKRLNGKVSGTSGSELLTSLRPCGMSEGSLLVPNAGLDQSNVPPDTAIGWPVDPMNSALQLKNGLEQRSGKQPLAVVVSDSACRMGRMGVTAIALTVAGFSPLVSMIGHTDLYGKPLKITVEALADQLATAANLIMGNANQSIPAVVIRDHGLTLSEDVGWVNGIDPEEDLFRDVMRIEAGSA
jgi:coenzyme F420-0:L-glutamate ligase / coenzyme F420-1:gamma-L-glutamate ligase